MKKRVVAMALLLVMMFNLAACAGPNGSEETTKAPQTNAPQTNAPQTNESGTDEEPSTENEHPGWLTEEKKTIRVFTYDGASSSYQPPSNDLFFWQWMEEYTNVHVEWEVVPLADRNTSLTTMLSMGEDLPDVMFTSYGTANDAMVNGLVIDMEEYWDTCFTNVQAYYDAEGFDMRNHLTSTEGGIPCIMGTSNLTEGKLLLMYNNEWMKKLGVEEYEDLPTTLDEFTALLRKIKAAGDMNGNGVDDEIPFAGPGVNLLMTMLASTFGLDIFQAGSEYFDVDENGKVYDLFTDEKMKALLGYMADLVKEGLLNYDIVSTNADALKERVANDQVGVVCYYANFSSTWGNLMPNRSEDKTDEELIMGPMLASEYNNNQAYRMMQVSSTNLAMVSAEAEDPELACKWLDVLIADPTALIVRCYGKEGVTFNYDENGEPQYILTEDGTIPSMNNYGCGQITLPHIQTDVMINGAKAAQFPWYMPQYDAFRESGEWRFMQIHAPLSYTQEEKDLRSLVSSPCKTCFTEMRAKVVSGDLNINEIWDEYVAEMKSCGIDDWTKVMQMVYDRKN